MLLSRPPPFLRHRPDTILQDVCERLVCAQRLLGAPYSADGTHPARHFPLTFRGHHPHTAIVQSENDVEYQINEGSAPIGEEGITLSFAGRKRLQVQTAALSSYNTGV